MVIGIIGESCTGKSTLAREIAGQAERVLTEREAEVGLEPRWVPLPEAVAIFSRHQEYAGDERLSQRA